MHLPYEVHPAGLREPAQRRVRAALRLGHDGVLPLPDGVDRAAAGRALGAGLAGGARLPRNPPSLIEDGIGHFWAPFGDAMVGLGRYVVLLAVCLE